MAPVTDGRYFPPVQHCLLGIQELWSWKRISSALFDETGRLQSQGGLIRFLSDPHVQNILKNPSTAFPAPHEASQRNFDIRIASKDVNAAFLDQADCFEDAEWLSRNANIDLVAALRIAVIELLSRSEQQLMGPLSVQDAANLKDATGHADELGSSLFSNIIAAAVLDSDDIAVAFNTVTSKRRRLFSTYLKERRFFMMTVEFVNAVQLCGRLPIFTQNSHKLAPLVQSLRMTANQSTAVTSLKAHLTIITTCMENLGSGFSLSLDDLNIINDEVELDWLRTCLAEAFHALSVIFQISDSLADEPIPYEIINQWFFMMEHYSFFENALPNDPPTAEMAYTLQILCMSISISFLKPAQSIQFLADRVEDLATTNDSFEMFLMHSNVLEQIHSSIIKATNLGCEVVTPVIFTWALILHRMNVSYLARTEKRDHLLQQNARDIFESGGTIRSTLGRRSSAGSIFSIESSKFDSFLENLPTSKDLQAVEYLASYATAQGKVFEVISTMATTAGFSNEGTMNPLLNSRIRAGFLELLKVSYPLTGYQSEPMSALLTILGPDHGYLDMYLQDALPPSLETSASMIGDDFAMEFFFQQALDRFPYEYLPFTTLCKKLLMATAAMDDGKYRLISGFLQKTPTLTFVLPDDFQEYELIREGENTNSFRMLNDLQLISSLQRHRAELEDDAYQIPAGTYGRFLTDTDRVVMMNFSHSTLSLIGRQLEVNLFGERHLSMLGRLQCDEAAGAISMLASLFRAEQLSGGSQQCDDGLFQICSHHITGGRDILAIVCDTMEFALQDESTLSDSIMLLLIACTDFLNALITYLPGRVWSYLARSAIVGSESRTGKLADITSTLDLEPRRFQLLMSALSLFSHLIENALASAVQRCVAEKAAVRHQSLSAPFCSGTNSVIISSVSLAIASVTFEIFDSLSTWRYYSSTCRPALMSQVAKVLDKIIQYSYGMGSVHSSSLTSPLRPAASQIIDGFLTSSSGMILYQPILISFIDALTASASALSPMHTRAVRVQIRSILKFLASLLQVFGILGLSASAIESNLFKSSTLVARLAAWSVLTTGDAVNLLESLITSAGRTMAEPHSLLGYLGPTTSRSLLRLLSDQILFQEYSDDSRLIWTFLTSVLRNKQPWMSICLLTGQSPREVISHEAKRSKSFATSVFSRALARLRSIKDLGRLEALDILTFVATAQDFWPWTVVLIHNDVAYLGALRAHVHNLPSAQLTSRSETRERVLDMRIAAVAAKIFTMQLYHLRHQYRQRDTAESFAQGLINDVDFYLRNGVNVGAYNKSLHGNFAKNFSRKYIGCSLEDLRRNFPGFDDSEGNYYDLIEADKMLQFDPAWRGSRNNGFRCEMLLANTNLSLVDAQLLLFDAWRSLLGELSVSIVGSRVMARQMLQVALQCFNTNQDTFGPEGILTEFLDARANFALLLILRLVKTTLTLSDIKQLLTASISAIYEVEEPFASRSVKQYRTLLKTLFTMLQAYQSKARTSEVLSSEDVERASVNMMQISLDALDQVVGHGMRLLVGLVHESDATVVPQDLALLTAVLQAVLRLPGTEQSQAQILNIMASHDVIQAATSLFSWADQLEPASDPVYGELSIQFLAALSSLPLLAEQLACEGLLDTLMSANLTKYMLKAKLSPTTETPVDRRCYLIWLKGFLPLFLDMLASLGAMVAQEIAYILNQFEHLLQAGVERLEAPGASRTWSKDAPHFLTLLAAYELHTVVLLTRVLESFRAKNDRDIPNLKWDLSGLLENVEFWLSSKRLLKEILLPTGDREMEWQEIKGAGQSEPVLHANLLEGKFVRELEAIRDLLREESED